MVYQDIEAMDASRDRLVTLAADADTLKDAAEDADPAFGTWGPFLGLLVGTPYSLFVSWQVKSLMEDVPAAIAAHSVRLDAAARSYQEADDGVADELAIIETSLEEVRAAARAAGLC